VAGMSLIQEIHRWNRQRQAKQKAEIES